MYLEEVSFGFWEHLKKTKQIEICTKEFSLNVELMHLM